MLPGNTGWYSDAETNKELFFFLQVSPQFPIPETAQFVLRKFGTQGLKNVVACGRDHL